MNIKNLIFGFLSGFFVGAVIGVLYAPHKGSITRRNIIKKGDEYSEAVQETVTDYVDIISDKFVKVKKDILEYSDILKEKIGELRGVKKEAMN